MELLTYHVLYRLFVLVADELDELAVENETLVHPDTEGCGVRLGIVDRDIDSQRAVVQTLEALGELRGVSQRAPSDVEPPTIFQSSRLDHERIALPLPHGIAVPRRLRIVVG